MNLNNPIERTLCYYLYEFDQIFYDWELVTIALQALSLVEKVEPVQVQFTLHSRDQQSKWIQDGCKVYMDSYMTLNGSCFMVIWTIFQNHL